MAKFAILTGNQVTACIVADDEATALGVSPKGVSAVEYTVDNPAGVGYVYDYGTGKFTAPVKEEPNA